MKKMSFLRLTAALAVVMLNNCTPEPTYFSEVAPETFFDSQTKVYQRFDRPFTHWASRVGNIPISYFMASQTLTSDEIVMPNRNGDWYDGGFYINHSNHKFSPAPDEGYWYYAWGGFSEGVAHAWSAKEDIEKNVDFSALGFPEGTKEWMDNQLNVLVAYFYLTGLDYFGGVPLYTSNAGDLLARATDKETFEYIEKLLTDAIPLLKKRAAGERADMYPNQGVAASLLARLYFNAEAYIGEDRYADCAQICDNLRNGVYGEYSLAPDYRDVFGFGNEYCPELIWAVPSEHGFRQVSGSRPEYGTHYGTWAYLDNPEAMSWNGICLIPSQDINGKHYRYETGNLGGPFKLGSPYDKFEATDVRKQNYLYGDPADGAKKYHGMFLYGKLINPLTGAACTADGSREYYPGDTIAMVDQIAQLGPDIPPKDKDGNNLYNYPKNGESMAGYDGPPAYDNPDTDLDESKWNPRYKDGRKEGVNFAEENSGVRLLKMSPIPNQADNATRFNPDVPVIRFAEILYMLAECKYHSGDKAGAASLINEVRARYFTTTGGDPNPVTAANLDKYRLADEWLIEFIGEGRRRTDLVRWGMFTTEAWWDHPADGAGKEYLNRFPIPDDAIGANSLLQQNPGY